WSNGPTTGAEDTPWAVIENGRWRVARAPPRAACRRLAGVPHPELGARPAGLPSTELAVAGARNDVVVHHAHRLHEGVADGRAHESEPELLQVPAQGVRLGGTGRNLAQSLPRVLPRRAVDEAPDVAVEAPELLLHREEHARVRDARLDLEAV